VTAAQAIAASGYHAAVDRGVTLIVSAWALCGGLAAVARGDLDDADRLLTEALAGFQANDIFRLTARNFASQRHPSG